MRIQLSTGDLQAVHQAAKELWLGTNNPALPPDCYVLSCFLQALSDHLMRQNVSLTFEVPQPRHHEVIDD